MAAATLTIKNVQCTHPLRLLNNQICPTDGTPFSESHPTYKNITKCQTCEYCKLISTAMQVNNIKIKWGNGQESTIVNQTPIKQKPFNRFEHIDIVVSEGE